MILSTITSENDLNQLLGKICGMAIKVKEAYDLQELANLRAKEIQLEYEEAKSNLESLTNTTSYWIRVAASSLGEVGIHEAYKDNCEKIVFTEEQLKHALANVSRLGYKVRVANQEYSQKLQQYNLVFTAFSNFHQQFMVITKLSN